MVHATLKKKLAVALGVPVALATLLELGLRLADFEYPPVRYAELVLWNPKQDAAMRGADDLHQPDAFTLWAPRPGGLVPWSDRGERVNAEGYRGPVRPGEHDGSKLRVVTMGDSSTFGLGVEYEETFSAQLEAILNTRGTPAEVLDFGVVGFTVLQGVERYRERVRHFHPDVVVTAFGAVNEQWPASEGPDPERLADARRRTTDWYAFLQRVRKELRIAHLVAYWQLQADGGMRARHARYVEPRKELNRIRDRSGELNWTGTRRVPLDDYVDGLDALRREVERDGARLVVIAMPRRPVAEQQRPVLREYTSATRDFAQEHDLPLCDARGTFLAKPNGLTSEQLFRDEDGRLDNWHPTPAGHRVIAECLADAVLTTTTDAR